MTNDRKHALRFDSGIAPVFCNKIISVATLFPSWQTPEPHVRENIAAIFAILCDPTKSAFLSYSN
jgi:hypothetical protein